MSQSESGYDHLKLADSHGLNFAKASFSVLSFRVELSKLKMKEMVSNKIVANKKREKARIGFITRKILSKFGMLIQNIHFMRFTFILSLIAALTFTASSSAQFICDDLIISEYLEGTGNNKGLEFFNPTSEAIDLSAYELQRWSNGEGTVTDATELFGTLPSLTTWVLVNGQTEDVDLGGGALSPMCDPLMQGMADQLDNPYPAPTYMNGNDALVLVKNGTTVVDIFGKPGENPGVAWTNDAENGFTDVGDGAAWLTSNHTLRRKFDVVHGVNVPPVVFDTFLEWDTLPVNTWDGLGSHSCACGSTGTNNLEETPSLEIFPNPAVNGQINIKSGQSVKQIEVYSPEGRLVKVIAPALDIRTWSIATSDWNAGVYFVNVQYLSGSIFAHRIVVR